ncbi:MAG: class I tRNA ligase family protein [Agriterribacter sp.]
MEYNFRAIEKKWQKKWNETEAYKVSNDSSKPKYYVLDMFPYPSGAGLHVGHPLGYIASDIFARYKRLQGFNVLHPMGYDAFGLPAEQYAIDHGIHPAVSTDNNISTFRKQLDNIGFCYDWSREVRTSDAGYYKWTQWIFLQLFKSWYNRKTKKAESIDGLIKIFEQEGNSNYEVPNSKFDISDLPAGKQGFKSQTFSSSDWLSFDEFTQQAILMEYRLAYCGYGEVNWCEALGTVLANDEVINGVSERGGYPVVKKKLRQWYLRITEYADRLQSDLDSLEWSDAMKEMQTNWIGKSSGAEVKFQISNFKFEMAVYTTRPDTIFGVDFMVLAPEHELVEQITTAGQKAAVEEYVAYVKSRSERERMAEKKISGCFTGAYAVNPLSGKEIPIWISEYVLAGYGTGAIMAVPSGDERDHKFAKFFNIPITNIFGELYTGEDAIADKHVTLYNSDFITGLKVKEAAEKIIEWLEDNGDGERKVNYKMRDAAFSRQRYWGEPFPIIWKDGIAYPLKESELPLELPHVDSYGPGPDGEGPLANIPDWYLTPDPSPQEERGAEGEALVPKYKVLTPAQFELARMMRKEYTEAEKALWEVLRNNKGGAKIRRQHPIDAYIVDFISLQDKLIIEIDGGYHESDEQRQYDEARTKVLKDIGFEVIRFTNEEVLKDPYIVKNKIKEIIERNKPRNTEISATPLRLRGGAGGGVRETNTMPGYAGSSWYFLRYMDPQNDQAFCDRKVSDYWNQVDLYIGGTEHAVGHLLYSRMWTKVLYDLGHIGFFEPFKKLVNQGMIQGSSRFVRRVQFISKTSKILAIKFVSLNAMKKLEDEIDGLDFQQMIRKVHQAFFKDNLIDFEDTKEVSFSEIHVDVNIVDGVELDIDAFRKWREEYSNAEFILEEGKYICDTLTEKMSKRLYNTVNPDDLVNKYGADTFRMYEMFLGPVEQSKPWDTKGIEGVHRFLKKLWRLFYDEQKGQVWVDEQPTAEELKVLHRTIKKITEDTERFSFNTGVSAFMIAVNELTDLKCSKKAVLEKILILLTPYAPHIAEELWHELGNSGSVLNAAYPVFEEKYLVESSKSYPVAINGKTRTEINIALDITQQQVEEIILADETVKKWLEGKQPKKIIYVKNRMINVVI